MSDLPPPPIPTTPPLVPPVHTKPGSVHTQTSFLLQPWSTGWVQTRDPARDGDTGSGPNAANNCGPESLCEVVMHLADVELDADYVWDSMKVPGGYTSLADLVAFLQRYCHTGAQILYPASRPEWIATIRSCLRIGHPLVGLFSFSAPGSADGHFRPIIGLTRGEVLTSDPWTGQLRTESYELAWSWAKGSLIHVQRSRAIGR